MPVFAYRAVDSSGRRSRGRLSGATAAAVSLALEREGLLPIRVKEVAKASRGSGIGIGVGRRRGVIEFTRSTAALLSAGMPLVRALSVATSTSTERIRSSLDAVRSRVERGEELATALTEHPRLFSSLYVGVVRAGEKSGALEGAFERLAGHLERDGELRSKLLSMSIYPALLAIVGVAAVLVLLLFVLPRFADLLVTSGATLPRATAAILSVSEAATAYWWVLLAAPPALLLLAAWLTTTSSGRIVGARLLVSVPIIGTWRKHALAAGFARMVGELLAGGAPVLQALEDAGDCMTDPAARKETERIRREVREGSSMNATISKRDLFPPVLAQLVALGEESGRLADFLLKAAELLERRTERSVERLVALVEPAMIVLFGGLVALVALALLQAVYGVNAGSFQ